MVSFASLDVYPKTLKEFRQRTASGAAVSIACAILIFVLSAIEIADFVQVFVPRIPTPAAAAPFHPSARAQVHTLDHLFVDTSRGQQMRINVNISFPALPCSGAPVCASDCRRACVISAFL